MSPLPAYSAKEPELFLEVLDEIKSSLFVSVVGQNTMVLLMEKFTRSSLENIENCLRYPETTFLHDEFKGKPAVVISAGPSLDRPGVLEALKAHAGNLVIGCVGQAAKALDKAGITPDFINVIEVKDVTQQLEGVSYMMDTNLILLPQANIKLFDVPSKRKLISHCTRDPMVHWLTKALGKPFFGFNHQGTVSISTLLHLMKMGCNPIFFLGQDLAYPEGKMYSQNSVYSGWKFEVDENGKKTLEQANIDEFRGIPTFSSPMPSGSGKTSNFWPV